MEDLVELAFGEAGQVLGVLDRPFQIADSRKIRPLQETDVGGDDMVLRSESAGQPPDQRAAHKSPGSGH